MENNDLELFKKGSFNPINTDFISDSAAALSAIEQVQIKYGKVDMDTLLNELHDSMVGKWLGFELVNTDKHGFDCKLSEDKDIFLESKVASISSQSWEATFNDTTYEKAKAFKDKKLILALSVWTSAKNCAFICYGQNEKIGDELKEGVDKFKAGKTVRSTQSIVLSRLVFDYGFKILAVNSSKEEVYEMLTKKRNFKKIDKDIITNIKDFKPEF